MSYSSTEHAERMEESPSTFFLCKLAVFSQFRSFGVLGLVRAGAGGFGGFVGLPGITRIAGVVSGVVGFLIGPAGVGLGSTIYCPVLAILLLSARPVAGVN